MPAHRDERRRVIDHLQAFRIAGFADGDERHAELLRGFDFLLGRFARTNLRRSSAAPPRQRGQGLERGARAAEMIDEGAECARPDILAADKAQPVEALFVGEVDAVHQLVHVCPQASVAIVARMSEAISGFCPPDYNPAYRFAHAGYLVDCAARTRSLHPPLEGEGCGTVGARVGP